MEVCVAQTSGEVWLAAVEAYELFESGSRSKSSNNKCWLVVVRQRLRQFSNVVVVLPSLCCLCSSLGLLEIFKRILGTQLRRLLLLALVGLCASCSVWKETVRSARWRPSGALDDGQAELVRKSSCALRDRESLRATAKNSE